jgi:AraC-like DNA-binding protein
MYGKIMLPECRQVSPWGKPVMFPRWGLGLHAMPTAAGYDVCRRPDYDWHGMRRGRKPFVVLQYTLSGEGRLMAEGVRHVVQPGTLMVVPIPGENRYWLPRGGSWEFIYLCMNGVEVMRACATVIQVAGPLLTLTASSPPIRAMRSLCVMIGEEKLASPFDASAQAYSMAMSLLTATMHDRAESDDRNRPEAVSRAIAFCRNHLERTIGVAEMAEAAGYSRYHFSRMFAASEGIGPAEFLTRVRLERAVNLLKHSGESIKTVADRCGFAGAGYFCKVFRKAYGVSPMEFRTSGMY